MDRPRSDLMVRTSAALQRLYRLQIPPRDAECSLYLLNNPHIHSVLATLAAISIQEWEILVSGRFDGFLWSGADTTPGQRSQSAAPPSTSTPFKSAPPTPFSPPGSGASQTPAPPNFGAPVQVDEETEIAALAEVERDIYAGMEALEDAFEVLHQKAEVVRAAMRTRGAGLAMSASSRRGPGAEPVHAKLGTPAVGAQGASFWGVGSELDDGIDARSELAPDDSASNISHHRRRRGKERRELKTPGTVQEEDESEADITPRRRR